MTFDQVRAFAESTDQSIRQIALTKEGARQLIAEHEREAGQLHRAGFEIPEGKPDAMFHFSRLSKTQAADKLNGWADVFDEIDAQRKAGLREVL